MAARLSRLIPAALCAAALQLSSRNLLAQAESSAAGWRQVITGDALQRAGALRLGEVLSLARAWQVTTVDEYTWRGSAGVLAPPGDDLWSVLVDGQPIHVALLGVLALERLPVDLGALDSIVLVAAPSLIAGDIASGGSLHFFTRRPARGIHARGRYATGAESGDPGPFGFLPDAVRPLCHRRRIGRSRPLWLPARCRPQPRPLRS